jgi:ABC-type sugar transport system permease subunit
MNAALRGRAALAPWVLVAPFMVLTALFVLWPLGQSVLMAFQQTFGPGHARWVGLDNFRAIFADPMFFTALKNTAVYTLGSVLIQMPLALALALALNRPDIRGRAWFRLIFFAPSLVGVVFVAMMFALLFEKRTGLLNVLLHAITKHTPAPWNLDFPWLENFVMSALIVASLWQWVGFNMVYFLAALQNVPKDQVEAATVDGAGPVARFFAVTWPAIRPVAGFVVLLSIVGSFQLFELPYIMLNSSAGPENRGLTLVLYLFQTGFGVGDLGYASAIGWLLAIMLLTLAGLQRLLGGRREGDVG